MGTQVIVAKVFTPELCQERDAHVVTPRSFGDLRGRSVDHVRFDASAAEIPTKQRQRLAEEIAISALGSERASEVAETVNRWAQDKVIQIELTGPRQGDEALVWEQARARARSIAQERDYFGYRDLRMTGLDVRPEPMLYTFECEATNEGLW